MAMKFPGVTLKNGSLTVAIDGATGALTVSGKGAGREWRQAPPSASFALTGLRRVSATRAVMSAHEALEVIEEMLARALRGL